jgi:hypothetical protein
MKRKARTTEERDHRLAEDLQKALEKVGPDGYARATAADFAPGGAYSATKKRRQRFALT